MSGVPLKSQLIRGHVLYMETCAPFLIKGDIFQHWKGKHP
jgi:hypothetical protein